MEIRGDILLKNSLWGQYTSFTEPDKIGCFDRLVDLYVVASSIGVAADQIIENDLNIEVTSIGRNTYTQNYDLSVIMEFLFQNAVLNSDLIEYDPDTRMKLAFDNDFRIEEFSPVNFLTKFANYGLSKILEAVSDHDMESIYNILDLLQNYIDDKYYDTLFDILKD